MPTTQANPQERTARELLTQQGTYLGTDGDGAAHYWDSYERCVAVVDRDGDGERWPLADTPYDTLGEWCEHVRHKRGWETGPRVESQTFASLEVRT